MIAIEGMAPAQQTLIHSGDTSLSLPVTGRIAVAVYLTLGGAEPRLDIRQIAMVEVGGTRFVSAMALGLPRAAARVR